MNNHVIVDERSSIAIPSATTTEASCRTISHCLRVPCRSTKGAQMNLSAHGANSTPVALISVNEYPERRNTTGTVPVKKPYGSPCAK